MSLAVKVLCRPEVAAGFGLAGIRAEEAASAEDTERLLQSAATSTDVALVLIEDRLYDALDEESRHAADRMTLPIVVPFPGPRWGGGMTPHDYVVEILRRAIGYRVQPR